MGDEADETSTLMFQDPWIPIDSDVFLPRQAGPGVKPVLAGSHGGRVGTHESANHQFGRDPGGNMQKGERVTCERLLATMTFRDFFPR